MLTPEDIERRAAAKRVNESFKLIASALNALSVATVGAAFLLPALNGSLNRVAPLWLLLALLLHLLGQAALRRLRSED